MLAPLWARAGGRDLTFTGFGFCHAGVVITSGHIPGATVSDRVFAQDERSPVGEGSLPRLQ